MSILITDIDKLAGKTIGRAKTLTWGELLALVFTDGSYAVLGLDYSNVYGAGDTPGIVLVRDSEISLSHKLEAGVISEEGYFRLKSEEAERKAISEEIRERTVLAALKEKYEPKLVEPE